MILPSVNGRGGGGQREGNVSRSMKMSIGTDSEIGRLRTVLVHRPGAELRRITPRTRERLKFTGLPWLARAQREHDILTGLLRDRGVEVLYVTELLQDVLEYDRAADEAIGSVLAGAELGEELGSAVRAYLESLSPEDLAAILISGLTREELRTGRGVVYELLDPHHFLIEPLPNLAFSHDSSVWIRDQAIVTSLREPRRREADLLGVIYGHHPRFTGSARSPYRAGPGFLSGGDVLLLAPGVVAVGVGVRTTPASVERLARHLLGIGAASAVLAVPMSDRGEAGYLDTGCTVVDTGTVVMAPALAFTLTALTITVEHGGLRVSRPRPFIEAAARAIGVDRLMVIDTGLDLPGGARGQWDDGANALVIGDRVAICDERNEQTNARLATAGFEVMVIPWAEFGGDRGGPRCMCVPVFRDQVADGQAAGGPDEGRRADRASVLVGAGGLPIPGPADPVSDPPRHPGQLTPIPLVPR